MLAYWHLECCNVGKKHSGLDERAFSVSRHRWKNFRETEKDGKSGESTVWVNWISYLGSYRRILQMRGYGRCSDKNDRNA